MDEPSHIAFLSDFHVSKSFVDIQPVKCKAEINLRELQPVLYSFRKYCIKRFPSDRMSPVMNDS